MLLCKADEWYRPHLGTDTLLSSQAALVSFATTGEKTVAAVMTCRGETVRIKDTSRHLGVLLPYVSQEPREPNIGAV